MDEPQIPTRPRRIDAAELEWVEVADDGRRLRLRLRDMAGHPASVSFPADRLNAILAAIPRSAGDLVRDSQDKVYTIDTWSLTRSSEGYVLSLSLPDGAKIAFSVKPWQIDAIASAAGPDITPPRRRLN